MHGLRSALIAAAVVLGSGCGGERRAPTSDVRSLLQIHGEPRFNEVQQKTVHNAFKREEGLTNQLAEHGVRSVELDIHSGQIGEPEVPGDWYVYHVDVIDRATSCERFSDCLGELGAFHRSVPDHEILTVFVDLKEQLTTRGHGPRQLDAAFARHFDRSDIVTPRDLIAACPGARTLQDAVTGSCSWPRMSELAGKMMFVVTGGDGCSPGDVLASYGRLDDDRSAFLAPTPSRSCPLSETGRPGRTDAAFVNLRPADAAMGRAVLKTGLVSRVWGLNDPEEWGAAARSGIHFLATDKVDVERDPWATTRANGRGFTCLGRCDEPNGSR